MTIFPHNFMGSRIQVNCFVTRVTRRVPLAEHLSGVRVTRSLVLCVIFCRSFFVLLAIVLFVLRFTDSDYPIGIFKIFLSEDKWLGCVYKIPDEQNKSKRSTNIHKIDHLQFHHVYAFIYITHSHHSKNYITINI
jgi:hypothetical protein